MASGDCCARATWKAAWQSTTQTQKDRLQRHREMKSHSSDRSRGQNMNTPVKRNHVHGNIVAKPGRFLRCLDDPKGSRSSRDIDRGRRRSQECRLVLFAQQAPGFVFQQDHLRRIVEITICLSAFGSRTLPVWSCIFVCVIRANAASGCCVTGP